MSESDVSFKHPEELRKLENNRSWGGDVYYLIANSPLVRNTDNSK